MGSFPKCPRKAEKTLQQLRKGSELASYGNEYLAFSELSWAVKIHPDVSWASESACPSEVRRCQFVGYFRLHFRPSLRDNFFIFIRPGFFLANPGSHFVQAFSRQPTPSTEERLLVPWHPDTRWGKKPADGWKGHTTRLGCGGLFLFSNEICVEIPDPADFPMFFSNWTPSQRRRLKIFLKRSASLERYVIVFGLLGGIMTSAPMCLFLLQLPVAGVCVVFLQTPVVFACVQ